MMPLATLDPELLRTLVVVAETRSFSASARKLELAQSTVSTQVRRLEEAVGRTLLARTTHGVDLTGDGEAMLGYARLVLDLAEKVRLQFSSPPFEGTLRFGFCDGVESEALPVALAQIRQRHPGFQFGMASGRVDDLLHRLDAGDLDLVLGAKPAGHGRGETLWTSPLVWLGLESVLAADSPSVPLVTRTAPSITRSAMTGALTKARRPWAVAFESDGFLALRAAALAGLGLATFPRGVVPAGMPILGPGHGLPDLGALEVFIATRADPVPDIVRAFRDMIASWTADLLTPPR